MLVMLPTPNARLESAHSQMLSEGSHTLQHPLLNHKNIAAIVCGSVDNRGEVDLCALRIGLTRAKLACVEASGSYWKNIHKTLR
jgi:hypothetical protein